MIKINYNPEIITFEELLKVFWENHDPTTLDKQGNDIGTQYRSIILYKDETQRNLSLMYKKKLNMRKTFQDPIVTQIVKLDKFYKAENYHQDYYINNLNQPYCQFIIKPKLDKFFNKRDK